MKRLLVVSFIFLIFLNSLLLGPSVLVSAKTIYDLEQELQKLEDEDKEVKGKIHKTEAEINQIKNEISQIYQDIDQIIKDIESKTNEIKQLDLDILEKDKETKEIMNFLQISNVNSIYLEYIMGADTLTDFIYRFSVAEQLTKHNTKLIVEMNELIKLNEQKKIELAENKIELEKKKVALNKKVNSLGRDKDKLFDHQLSVEDEIKAAKEVIKLYKDAGCGLHEDINVCANRLLPPDTRFWRPLVQGYVTSEYGYRKNPVHGAWQLHDGIDLGNKSGDLNTKVYAAARGKVVKIDYHSSMGNYITIHHNINGQTYTTQYLHLKTGSIQVKVGELVTKNTFIAIMGNTGNSTGAHLHFSVATGLYFKDYLYDGFRQRVFDPRKVVNFPSGIYNYWYDRVSFYN
ncbi:MAG: peptidoglycan DD-metalloendopeptidase family protein [Bacilli bacterium]|jgi:murein DD-endopeptidase MepM/ murein hydrolase activator NlpD